ncbi:hypothetical protein J6590_057367 [Homalodisca vitripennis]|nr:hypothetical protein J6590_057367 [Homalodisca vitripennis]
MQRQFFYTEARVYSCISTGTIEAEIEPYADNAGRLTAIQSLQPETTRIILPSPVQTVGSVTAVTGGKQGKVRYKLRYRNFTKPR